MTCLMIKEQVIVMTQFLRIDTEKGMSKIDMVILRVVMRRKLTEADEEQCPEK